MMVWQDLKNCLFVSIYLLEWTLKGAIEKDQQRIKNMNNKFQETVKMKRKKLRAVRKGYIDKEKDNEGGELYLTGNF